MAFINSTRFELIVAAITWKIFLRLLNLLPFHRIYHKIYMNKYFFQRKKFETKFSKKFSLEFLQRKFVLLRKIKFAIEICNIWGKNMILRKNLVGSIFFSWKILNYSLPKFSTKRSFWIAREFFITSAS